MIGAVINNSSLPDPHYYSSSGGDIGTLTPPDTSSAFSGTEKCIRVGECKKRRRNDSPSSTCETDKHALCWDAFQPYLEKCIPVKISDVASFRHVIEGANKNKEPVFSTMRLDSLPAEVLDTSFTVQCVPNINHGIVHPSDLADDDIRQKARNIDEKISMLPNTTSETPTFMGQEDQVTTCMSLRELLSIDKHIHHMSASQLPILDVEEMEQDSISLNVDGKLNHQPTPNLKLSALASLLRLPSYLLLGNPHNEPKDIFIHNINLWHAPQSCCTNVHYDDHDNLLIVTSGEKIVELYPPGCLKASAVYSTHANHPELLRRRSTMQTDENIQREIKATLERKRGRTHIVNVTAGEALYIPLGWWHRVVSKCDKHDSIGRSNGCTAINVWFDYHHPSRQNNIPEHMSVFHLRQSSRKYFELNKDYATNLLLETKKRTYFLENKEIEFAEEITNEDNAKMNAIVFENELDKPNILAFGVVYRKSLLCTPRTASADPLLLKDPFYCMLEAFLLRIQLENASHVAGLVSIWTEVGLPDPHVRFFSEVLCKLSPEACYILTQAWERHAGVNTCVDENGETQDEAEISYRRFFSNVTTYSKEVRNHLLNGVEEFYHQAWVQLSSTVL
jgi:hypothetical protein